MKKIFFRVLNSFRTVCWENVLWAVFLFFYGLCLGAGLYVSLMKYYFCISDIDMQRFFEFLIGVNL